MTDVSTPSEEYVRLSAQWKLPRTLMGGTKAMRAAAITYLPMEAAESEGAYRARLSRSTLFNAFRKTVKDMTGKVFTKPIVLGDDVPEKLVAYSENIDNAGRHLNVFARDVFFDSLQPGIGFILAEMPAPIDKGSGRQGEVTKADESAAGRRPYLCFIKAEDVIGWKSAIVNGVMTLTQVRIRETVTEPDGPFAEKAVTQIRVLSPGAWEIWQEATDASGKKSWVKVEEGKTSLNKIPLAPVYINRTGFMTGEPPLEDLADLNVAHWQSASDLRNINHASTVPILFMAGFDDDTPIEIGGSKAIRSSKPEAKIDFVEHSGSAIGQSRELLRDLELQMQAQGLQLLIDGPGGQTATGEIRDDAKENSPLAMMAGALQDALEAGFGFMAEYEGLGADAGGSITVNTDFGLSTMDVPQVIACFSAGLIDAQTAVDELKRRNFLSGDVDAEVVMERLQNQMRLEAKQAMDLNAQSSIPAA